MQNKKKLDLSENIKQLQLATTTMGVVIEYGIAVADTILSMISLY